MMAADPFRLSIEVRGRVQGVGYDAAVRKHARALGLRGWIRNELDGSVKMVVEGPRDCLISLRDFCRQGPPFARVDQTLILWSEPTGEFSGFDIRRDRG